MMKKARKLMSLVMTIVLTLTLSVSVVQAAQVTNQNGATDDYGGWKHTHWQDSSTRNQYLYVYTDCWSKSFTTRYHEHVMYAKENQNVSRLTIVVQPKYYSTGGNIGSQRKYEVRNNHLLRVMPQGINSGNKKVTLFACLESVYTTATLTYHNIYGV